MQAKNAIDFCDCQDRYLICKICTVDVKCSAVANKKLRQVCATTAAMDATGL